MHILLLPLTQQFSYTAPTLSTRRSISWKPLPYPGRCRNMWGGAGKLFIGDFLIRPKSLIPSGKVCGFWTVITRLDLRSAPCSLSHCQRSPCSTAAGCKFWFIHSATIQRNANQTWVGPDTASGPPNSRILCVCMWNNMRRCLQTDPGDI